MKTIYVGLVAAGLLLTACGQQMAATPTAASDENICLTGTEFVPGETIFLGSTADFAAILRTTKGGFESSATLYLILPDGSFPPSGSVLPKEGETIRMEWKNLVGVTIANCDGRYRYTGFVREVELPARDACAADFGGPLKPWPFSDRILLYRPGGLEEVWLFSGSSSSLSLLRRNSDNRVAGLDVTRPLDGKSTLTLMPVAGGGTLEVTIKNCAQALYYQAVWVAGG